MFVQNIGKKLVANSPTHSVKDDQQDSIVCRNLGRLKCDRTSSTPHTSLNVEPVAVQVANKLSEGAD